MLKQLQFVRGAVNKFKMDLSMQHFVIRDGRVTGYNGVLAISSPIPISLECQPGAQMLIKAVGNCKAAVVLSLTPGGKLRLKSGPINVMIPTYQDVIAEVWPEGELIPVKGPVLLDALRKLVPFVGTDDSSNQWANGILFSGGSAFATNNHILVECWVDSLLPHAANVPLLTVKEILRVGEPPTHVSMGEGNMTFHFEGERWIRTQLYSAEWPTTSGMLPTRADKLKALPHDFWDAVEVCRDFKDDRRRIYLQGKDLRTSIEQDEGAHVECSDHAGEGIYNVDHLWLLKDHVVAADFSSQPGKFMGEKIRGVITPMRR